MLLEKIKALIISKTNNSINQIIRYGSVSVICILTDVGLLFLLTEFANIHYLVSGAISYLTGMIINYVLSIFWVFPHRQMKNRGVEFLIFVAIGIAGGFINEGILWLCTDIFKIYYLISRGISAIIGFVWKYIVRKKILFTKKNNIEN